MQLMHDFLGALAYVLGQHYRRLGGEPDTAPIASAPAAEYSTTGCVGELAIPRTTGGP